MSECNLHFGDPTTHFTVEWFLHSLTEETLPSEDLCKELNVVRFIDCMRKEVKDKEYFDRIENIAKELNEDQKWMEHPHLSALLFSMARKYLEEKNNKHRDFVKKTSLYCIARGMYEHFKTNPNSYESCSHVFKTGFQLVYFEEKDEWHYEFSRFKDRYYKELSKLRMHYYSVDNPTDFSLAFINRISFTDINEEFNRLRENFGNLNPMCLELPIPIQSSEASKFAYRFSRNVRRKEIASIDNTEMAKKMRIIQWEILVRNLAKEAEGNELRFYPITDAYEVQGIPDQKFLSSFIEEARRVEYSFTPSYGETPTKKRNNTEDFSNSDENLINKIRVRSESFGILLREIPDHYIFVHKDIVSSFANMRQHLDDISNVMLIEDGEFSFFSLLWLLRYAVSKKEEVTDWTPEEVTDWTPESKHNKKLTVRFHPGFHVNAEGNLDRNTQDRWNPSEVDWSKCDIIEFAEELGLIIRLSDKECIPTNRWRSLIIWLRELNSDLNGDRDQLYKELEESVTDELKYNHPLLERLKIKKIDHDKDRISFIRKLSEFFVENWFDQLDTFSSDASVSYGKFIENLRHLIVSMNDFSLLTVESPAGLDDTVILRCCRGFIPLEYLFRAYYPCEFHLLLQALNWERSPFEDEDWKEVPTSVSGATIVGQVKSYRYSKDNSESTQDETTDFDQWIGPYHTLFSVLSPNISLPELKGDSKQTGAIEQQKDFVHQTMGLLDMAWIDPSRNKLNSQSQFALWLARTQVTSIWGSLPIDTEEKIYDKDFLDWKCFSKKTIIEELVDRGLWGGIRRAARAPKDDDIDNPEWDLTDHGEKLIINPGKAIIDIRKSLSFKLPETDPPDWVTTKAFAVCFYHAMRQAVYHALKTFVLIDGGKSKIDRYLWVEWDKNNQFVTIYNRGQVNREEHCEDFKSNDRGFFMRFVDKTDEFCRQNRIDEVFKIDGPEPADIHDRWQLVIRKEKLDEF